MRRLSTDYWNKFKKVDAESTKVVRDGLMFEDLVEELLQQKFPYGEWHRTKKSHDDNRDFYLTNAMESIWAECKNFSGNISLKVIAPTLIMARIYSVNRILFFSYSKINKKTREKLALYAEKTNSEISIYDDELLDEIILTAQDTLSSRFKPKREDIYHVKQNGREFDVSFYIVRDIISGALTDDELMYTYESAETLSRFSPFEVVIYVDIPDNIGKAEIYVTIPTTDNNGWFVNLHPMMEKDANITITTLSQNICIRIPLKPILSAESVTLPQISVRVNCNGKDKLYNSPDSKARLLWNNEIELTGNEYRSCVSDFNDMLIGRSRFCCFALQGKSGIGKSRLLREMRDRLIANGYKIINFLGTASENITIILREIIAFLYDIPSVDISSMVEDDILSETADANEFVRAYRILGRISSACKDGLLDMEFIDMIAHLIAEKSALQKTAIVIDDLQKYGDIAVAFFSKLIEYASAMQRLNQSVLLFSYNNDYGNDRIVHLMMQVSGAQKDDICFTSKEIKGFGIGESESFIRNLLFAKDEKFRPQLRMILSRYNNPYMIKDVVKQLISASCIVLDNKELVSIPRPDLFKEILENLPIEMSALMISRYESFLEHNSTEEIEVLAILSLVSLLPGVSRKEMIALSLDEKILNNLCAESILYESDNEGLAFVHDQFERACIKYKGDDYFQIISKVISTKLTDCVKAYPVVYAMCTIKEGNMPWMKTREWSALLMSVKQREVCGYYIYKRTITYILGEIMDEHHVSEAIKLAMTLCYSYRNAYGYESSLQLFDIVNKSLLKLRYEVLCRESEYRTFVDTYADTLRIVSRTDDALRFLHTVSSAAFFLPDDDQKNALLAITYNREMVVYRDFDHTKDYEARVMTYYKKSMFYVEKINNRSLREEMIYLNESDLGYLYYTYRKNHSNLISLWKKCLDHCIDYIPSKTLNIYRKTAQLCLINGDVNGARMAADLMRKYLLENDLERNKLVFSIFLKKLDVVCSLLDWENMDFSEVGDNIDEVMTMDMLRNPMKMGDSFMLKGIYFFYVGEYDTAIGCFEEALTLTETVPYTLNRKAKIDLIKQNISQCRCIIRNITEKISVDSVNGILTTKDGLLNLPLLV